MADDDILGGQQEQEQGSEQGSNEQESGGQESGGQPVGLNAEQLQQIEQHIAQQLNPTFDTLAGELKSIREQISQSAQPTDDESVQPMSGDLEALANNPKGYINGLIKETVDGQLSQLLVPMAETISQSNLQTARAQVVEEFGEEGWKVIEPTVTEVLKQIPRAQQTNRENIQLAVDSVIGKNRAKLYEHYTARMKEREQPPTMPRGLAPGEPEPVTKLTPEQKAHAAKYGIETDEYLKIKSAGGFGEDGGIRTLADFKRLMSKAASKSNGAAQ